MAKQDVKNNNKASEETLKALTELIKLRNMYKALAMEIEAYTRAYDAKKETLSAKN